jgi:hypothetical protein
VSITIHNASIKKVVFLVENVFFVIVLISGFEPIKLWVFDICRLSGLTPSFKLVVQAHYFILIKFRDVLILIFFALTIVPALLVHSESQIVPLLFTFLNTAVLFFPASYRSDLVSFGPVSRRNQLRVMVRYRRLMGYLCQILVLLSLNQFGQRCDRLLVNRFFVTRCLAITP